MDGIPLAPAPPEGSMFALVLACTSDDLNLVSDTDPRETGGPPTTDTAGTSTTMSLPGGAPAGCIPGEATTIADPTVPSADLDHSAQSVSDQVVGAWSGSFAHVTSTDASATLTPTAWWLVEQVGVGMPDEDCPPFYRIEATIGLSSVDDTLQETFAGVIEEPAYGGITVFATQPLDSVVGTLRPTFDTIDWSIVTQVVTGSIDGAELNASILWWGAPAARMSTGTATATTGTVMPSGVTETAGNLTLHRGAP